MSKDGQKMQGQVNKGIMASIYTKMSGHPTCEFVIDYPKDRKWMRAGDTLQGKIQIKTTVDG